MEKWLAYSLATLILWGLWGVLLKKASTSLEWYQLYVAAGVAIMTVVTAVTAYYGVEHVFGVKPSSWLLGFASGLLGTVGYIFLVKSLDAGGEASVVIPLTSLYPLLTAILSFVVLGEELTLKKMAGIVAAVVAIILLST